MRRSNLQAHAIRSELGLLKKLIALILGASLLGTGSIAVGGGAAFAAPVHANTAGPQYGSLPKITFAKQGDQQVLVQWSSPTGYVGNLDKYVLKQGDTVVFEGLANSFVATVPYDSTTKFTISYFVSLNGQQKNIGAGYNYINGTPAPPPAPDPATLAKISLPNPTLISRTENSLTVTWGQPTVTGVLKPGYVVRAFDPNGRNVAGVNATGNTATLTGLQPGIVYAVNVYADVVSQDGSKRITGLSVLCVATSAATGPAPVPPPTQTAPAAGPSSTPAQTPTASTRGSSAAQPAAGAPNVKAPAVPGTSRNSSKVDVSVTIPARAPLAPAIAAPAEQSRVVAIMNPNLTLLRALTPGAATIQGDWRVGSTLTTKVRAWDKSTDRTYQWFADGRPIPGATKSTLNVPAAARGKAVTVKVTGTEDGAKPTIATSVAIVIGAV